MVYNPKTWAPNDPLSSADLNHLEQGVYDASLGSVPVGGIIAWYGDPQDPPEGWAVCDGTNGTPDLRDRFIVGAGSSYQVGETGGADKVALTVDELPPHKHTGGALSSGGHTHTVSDQYHPNSETAGPGGGPQFRYGTTTRTVTTSISGSHTHVLDIDETGGGQPHENRPPYYALVYIMRIAD